MDTFKIVATNEKRGVYFTAVPHKWERNKTLFWPEHLSKSQREVLRCNPASAPDSKWTRYQCILKLQNIVKFAEALDFEKKFENCADTDAEEEMFAKLQKSSHYVNRNHLFTEISTDDGTSEPELNVTESQLPEPLSSKLQGFALSDESLTRPEVITINEIGTTKETSEEPQIIYEWKSLTQENDLLKELSEIKSEIKEIKYDMISFRLEFESLKSELKNDYKKASVLFDEICKKLDNLAVNDNFQEKAPASELEEDHLKKFSFPLQTVTEMNRLDDELRNNESFKKQLINFLIRIGGSSGQNDATKVAYKIADMLFSPEILTRYSWTGISKRKENLEKNSFTALKKIIEVIFEVLSKSDDRHTKEKNERIIRDGILKHAKKRYERKCQQTEAKKDLVTAENEIENKSNQNKESEQKEDRNQPKDKGSDSDDSTITKD